MPIFSLYFRTFLTFLFNFFDLILLILCSVNRCVRRFRHSHSAMRPPVHRHFVRTWSNRYTRLTIDRSSASPDRVPSSFRSNRANRQTRAPTFPGTPKPTGRLSSATTRHRSTSPKPSDAPPATLGRRHCMVRTTESPYMPSCRPLRLYLL